jgi:hypothetical protein
MDAFTLYFTYVEENFLGCGGDWGKAKFQLQ